MSVQGKSRSGWLVHPLETVYDTFVVEEKPVILRASNAQITYVVEQRLEPTQQSAKVYTWVPFIFNGQESVLGLQSTALVISLPGVYRVKSQLPGTQSEYVSFEEDVRDIKWLVSMTGGIPGPQGLPGGGSSDIVISSASSISLAPVAWGRINVGGVFYVLPLHVEQAPT